MELNWMEEVKIKLISNGLEFVDSATLEAEGYVHPPDIKLLSPFIYKGKTVNWIDTVPVYGTSTNHAAFTVMRLRKFVDDMGPGMFIYWAGFNECLNQESDEEIVVADKDFAISAGDIEIPPFFALLHDDDMH